MAVRDLQLEIQHRGVILCRVVLGLTCYFKESPTREQIVRAYTIYRKYCPPNHRALISTVRQAFFSPIDADDLSHINRSLKDQDRRLDDGIIIWNGSDAQQWMFWMQGIVGKSLEDSRASFCQLFLPESTDPEVLFSISREFGDEVPLLSGHGGYTVQFAGQYKNDAFNQIYVWAKRFVGLEVEDLNCTLPYVLDSVKGANWLSLVGPELWNKVSNHKDFALELPELVTLEKRNRARLFKAGRNPTLADRNRNDFPELYAAVEQILAPIKLQNHPEFPGRFSEKNETKAWLQRLNEPSAW